MKKQNKKSIILYIYLGIFLFFPLLQMMKVDWSILPSLVSSKAFKEALINSISVSIISTLLSICIAYILAWAINNSNIKHKAILKMLITLPMLIPTISHGLGLINLFGTNGIISSIVKFNIIGKAGIVIGSILYSFPVAFLLLDDGYKYIDNSLYASAKVLGLNKWQIFKRVTLPYLKKPLISSLFAIFTMIFTDYGVPLAIGGKYITLPVFLYKEVIGLLNYSSGAIIGLFLLIPAFISFIVDNFLNDYTNSDLENRNITHSNNKTRDVICNIIIYFSIFCILLIIGSFLYYAFIDNPVLNPVFSLKHIQYVLDNNIGKYIFNSVIIALGSAILGTFVAYFSAYITARVKGKLSRILHFLIISALAIPGVVLGLSYTMAFNNTFLYNTYIILIIVNSIHFIANPYLMAYNALQKVNPNYEIIGKTCNISNYKIIKDIIIPCTKSTIREMFAYFFTKSTITISAVAFLFNTKTMPLSLMINNYKSNMMLGEAAIISLIILFINLIVKGTIYFLNRKESRNNKYEN